MAVKGYSYAKTTWAFEERPVASSKLNLWDERVEAAVELAHFLLNSACGGTDGVIRGATTDDLKTVALATPGMSVKVKPGYAFVGKFPYKLAATTQSADVSAPLSHPRIDLVQARLASWDIGIKAGEEATVPVAPTADLDCIPLGRLHLRVGMTCIKDVDDGTNGYIEDAREFL